MRERNYYSKYFNSLLTYTDPFRVDRAVACENDPGHETGIVLMFQAPGLVRLAAEEGRDLELIVIHRLLHRQ